MDKILKLADFDKTDDSVTQKCPTSKKLVIKILVPFHDIVAYEVTASNLIYRKHYPHILLTLLYTAAAAHQKTTSENEPS